MLIAIEGSYTSHHRSNTVACDFWFCNLKWSSFLINLIFFMCFCQGVLKICQLPSTLNYDNHWPVQKVGLAFIPLILGFTCSSNHERWFWLGSIEGHSPSSHVLCWEEPLPNYCLCSSEYQTPKFCFYNQVALIWIFVSAKVRGGNRCPRRESCLMWSKFTWGFAGLSLNQT